MRGRFYLFARFVRRFGAGRVVGVCALVVGLVGAPVVPAGAASALPSDLELIFPGGGWGHGHGMSQYGARAQAEAGRSWQQILHSYYRDVDIVNRGSETMRVLVGSGSAVTVGGPESYTAKWSSGTTILSSSASYPYMRVRVTADGVALDKGSGPGGPWWQVTAGSSRIRFYPAGSVMPVVASSKGYLKYYRGFVEAYRRSSSTMYAINQLSMDKYLYGVVPRESPSFWHASALRAQAVAARSYSSWKRANASSSASYYICATTQCQVYGGYGYRTSPGASMTKLERTSTNDAVNATAGMTMVSGGEPIFAEFHSSSGGHTAQGSRSYLAPVADSWDKTYSPHYRWTGRVGVAEVEARWPAIGRLRGFADVRRDGDGAWGGRVTSLTLVGTSANVTVSGNTFRSAFSWWPSGRDDGLRSTLFGISVYDSALAAAPGEVLVEPGGTGTASVRLKNTGTAAWPVGKTVQLGTWNPKNRASAFRDGSWISASRATYVDRNLTRPDATTVNRGEVGEFRFVVRAPVDKAEGLYQESFRPVASGYTWFGGAVVVPVRVAVLEDPNPVEGPDFDGDGFGDLAIGAPGENGGAGGVNVLYGSAGGLSASGNQLWTQDSTYVDGRAGAGDRFGSALAAGDFDGDGYDDLAVGTPGERDGAGAVNVLYGSARGLSASGDQLWTQDASDVRGSAAAGDRFGAALATGDLDADGYDDLAIGAPGERSRSGGVNVLYGSSRGLTASGNQLWTQDASDVRGKASAGDGFGSALAIGDFNRNRYEDLAVGAPGEDAGGTDAGGVNVLYGSGRGLTASGNQLWSQDSTDIRGATGSGDRFGAALTVGDFNGNHYADLAVGIPGEVVGGRDDAGAVGVLYGSGRGLTASGNQLWSQDGTGVTSSARAGERFGAALTGGDFDGDGFSDVGIGVPGETVSDRARAGAVNVLYGSGRGLTASGNQFWTQDAGSIAGRAGASDGFGSSIAMGNFNADRHADLAVGVPGEDVNARDAGAANVLYGASGALTASGNQLWSQDTAGILGTARAGDRAGLL